MKRLCAVGLAMMLATAVAAQTATQELYIYPTKGQTAERQEQDRYECHDWAKQQTGFDPSAGPIASSPPPSYQAPTASVGRGAVTGAVGGALIGGIAGNNWGKGAAIGAVSGGIFGGVRRNSQQAAQAQAEADWSRQQQANYEAQRKTYNRAYTACLEGRGYTVK